MAEDLGKSIPGRLIGLEALAAADPAETIVDVGVFMGTQELYEAFGDRRFVLVDPIKNAADRLQCAPDDYVFVNKALGSRPGKVILNAMGSKTTISDRTALSEATIRAQYEVEVITLDTVIEEHCAPGKVGVKIDTEGYELEVVRGLQAQRERVSFVICETSVRKRFVDGYVFSDLVAAMKDAGFEFYNFMNNRLQTPRLYDILFLRSDDRLFE